MSSKFDSYQGIRGGYQSDNFDHNTATLLLLLQDGQEDSLQKENSSRWRQGIEKDDQLSTENRRSKI